MPEILTNPEPSQIDKPKYISYVVTNRCVGNCEFCLTPNSGKKDVHENQAKKIIDTISREEIEQISFAGREPFLRSDIWDLIEHGKRDQLKINIESTAITLSESDIQRLLGLEINWLSITSDNFEESLAKQMQRPYLSKEQLIKLTREFASRNDSHLKVSSVVSNVTKKFLADVGRVLAEYPPEVWKLRQFVPRGQGNNTEIERRHDLETSEFEDIVNEIRNKFHKIKIISSGINDYTGALIMIQPDGDVVIPHCRNNIRCGNMIKDEISLTELWKTRFSESERQLHRLNYYKTYIEPLPLRAAGQS